MSPRQDINFEYGYEIGLQRRADLLEEELQMHQRRVS